MAIQEEIDSLVRNETWEIVKKPDAIKLVDSRWIFKKKADQNDALTQRKARLVVPKGFMQKKGVNYSDTYAPVARLPKIRLLLSVGIKYNFIMEHIDVKTAFLNGDLEETVYMKPPEGIEVQIDHVLKLRKSLYGLKKSPRCWNQKFHSCMTKYGFTRSTADPCLYVKTNNCSFLCLVYRIRNEGLG